jgi:hypothetical protein
MLPETSAVTAVAAAPPPTDTLALLLSLLLPQAVRIMARAAVPAIHADRTARVLFIEILSFLGPLGRDGSSDPGVDGLVADVGAVAVTAPEGQGRPVMKTLAGEAVT